MHAQARQVVEDARLKLAPGAVEVRLMEGGVRERLPQTAEEWKADLIVLGARGLSGHGSIDPALRRAVALSGGRHYRRTSPVARLLAAPFAGTALRPPLPLAFDALMESFALEEMA